jgi:hypothetical protein
MFTENFTIPNSIKQEDALSPLLFNFSSEYALGNVQDTQVGLKLNGTHQPLAYAHDASLLGSNEYTRKKGREMLTDANKEVGLEINLEKTKYMLLSRHHNVGQSQNTK